MSTGTTTGDLSGCVLYFVAVSILQTTKLLYPQLSYEGGGTNTIAIDDAEYP